MADLDVLVIGGGPAGSTTAAVLARQGLSVGLVERDTFPRHHVGESLQPAAFELLDLHLGLGRDTWAGLHFQRKYGALYQWGETTDRWGVLFDRRLDTELDDLSHDALRSADYEHAWHVRRAEFDHLLMQTAQRSGVTVRQAEVAALHWEGDRLVGADVVEAGGASERVTARQVVDASGQRCLVGRKLGLVRNHDDLKSLALYGYLEGDAGLPSALGRDATLIVSISKGWVWWIPVGPRLTSVGLVTVSGDKPTEADLLDALREADVPLDGMTLRAEPDGTRTRYVRDWSYHLARRAGPGWVSVGDAAGFVDPILSGGCEFAIRGGCDAAIAVARALHGEGDAAVEAHAERASTEFQAYLRLARYWYGNNRSVDGFYWEARREVPPDAAHLETPLRAFVYLTAGKYAADKHYKVFIEWQEQRIFERLGVDAAAMKRSVAKAKARLDRRNL